MVVWGYQWVMIAIESLMKIEMELLSTLLQVSGKTKQHIDKYLSNHIFGIFNEKIDDNL